MKLKQHTKEYSFKRSLGFKVLTIVLLFLTIGSFYITIDSWNVLELGSLGCSKESCNYQIHDLMIIPLILINHILIVLTICSFVSIFKKLKSYNEEGSILSLFTFSIASLIIGLVLFSIAGLIASLIFGLIGGSIFGLIVSSIAGSIAGLIIGLIIGLINEFN